MTSITKVLLPNKEWLVKNDQEKIGGLSKDKHGYSFFHKGKKIEVGNLIDINNTFGITLDDAAFNKIVQEQDSYKNYTIYGFPCKTDPHEPIYSVKKKLPLYTPNAKSKSQYCAGYYVIQTNKGWVKSFCPKLITLERYPYHGPVKTELEANYMMDNIDKL